jgi:hypothetical protein
MASDSSVRIGYGLDGNDMDFCLLHRTRTSALYPMGIGDLFPGLKLAEHEAEYSPPSSAQSNNMKVYRFTPHTYVLMAWGYIDLLPILITTWICIREVGGS